MVGAGAMGGAFWGMLFGLLFFIPFLGLAIGAGMGALLGKAGKTGIDQQVLEQMGDAVPPGKAGWFLVIGQMTEDKFMEAVEGTSASVVRTNLTAGAGGAAQARLRRQQAQEVKTASRDYLDRAVLRGRPIAFRQSRLWPRSPAGPRTGEMNLARCDITEGRRVPSASAKAPRSRR